MECSAGTFYDAATKTCKYCPVGEHQSSPGQIECIKCADGASTETFGSVSIDECYGKLRARQEKKELKSHFFAKYS